MLMIIVMIVTTIRMVNDYNNDDDSEGEGDEYRYRKRIVTK